MTEIRIPESRPMKKEEMDSGKYVCVTPIGWIREGGCVHSPHITIHSNGVWLRSFSEDNLNPGTWLYSSAHRDCFEHWIRRAEFESQEIQTAPLPNTGLYRGMAVGHKMRKGHEMKAHLEGKGSEMWEVIYECCEGN